MNVTDAIDDYGPALAADPHGQLIVTLDGAYFNVWARVGNDWKNTDALDAMSRLDSVDPEKANPFDTLAGVPLQEAQEAAEAILERIRQEGAPA